VKVANDAQCEATFIYTKASPSEIVTGGFQALGAGGSWNGKILCIVKVNLQSFQLGTVRKKGNY
jgi:hypothetical protein